MNPISIDTLAEEMKRHLKEKMKTDKDLARALLILLKEYHSDIYNEVFTSRICSKTDSTSMGNI